MKYSVIIIGAGMSGAKAALDLYNAGETNTLILEARDRLGGRLLSKQSTKNEKVYYDLGASWFHDALDNPLFEKAKKLGNVSYFFDDGKYHYVSETSKNIPTWTFELVVKEIGSFCDLLYDQNPNKEDLTVKELCSLYLEKYGKLLTADEIKYAKQVVRMWCELWDGILWDEMSAKQSLSASGVHLGRNAYVKNGFYTVFENELNELPSSYRENNIVTGTQVSLIDYLSKDLVTITTSDGKIFTADYVISTVPISILRISDDSDKQCIKWNPPLPKRFAELWPQTEVGSLGKVVFEFEKCFWPEDVQRFYILASQDDYDTKAKPWQHPSIAVNYMPMAQLPSLVFLTQEPVSKQVENMSQEEIWNLFLPVLTQIATGPVERPLNVIHTPWNSDPYARGSYSAGRYDTFDVSAICGVLSNGVTDRVRFAGAETMDGTSNGCAHGAWLSGEREARHILTNKRMTSKF